MNCGLEKLRDGVLEAIFPSNIYCIRCGSLIDSTRTYALCDDCVRKLHWITGRSCEKCGKALPDVYRGTRCYDCMTLQHSFTKGYSCLTYGLYEREILMDLKYNGKGYLAMKLGDMMYDRMMCEDLKPDVIIPVPTGRQREKKRGYNQAELLAKRLGKRWSVDVDTVSLCRKKETKPLRSLTPAEREAALADAFGVEKNCRHRIEGKTILLIDDIYTTGATADACSRALLQAGAKDVYFLSLASGGNRKPDAKD